jgi:hypothetical protein
MRASTSHNDMGLHGLLQGQLYSKKPVDGSRVSYQVTGCDETTELRARQPAHPVEILSAVLVCAVNVGSLAALSCVPPEKQTLVQTAQ